MNESAPLFDPALVRRRIARARRSGYAGFLLERVAEDLEDRLAAVTRSFPLGLDLGAPLPLVSERLLQSGRVERMIRLAPVSEPNGSVVGDPEVLPFGGHAGFDLAVSALALQHVNDLPGALLQVRRALKPDGLFLAGLLGGATLTELRQAFLQAESETEGGASPRVAPFAELRDLGGLLQRAGFALPVVDADTITVRYGDPFSLMRDLRAMGLTNALHDRRRAPLRRATLMRAAAIYAERFSDPDGRLRATFEILWLSGWAPHESQQKPLRPGSAKARLADALGAAEHRFPIREEPA
ncbi:methyltransferase domain-containing protein [Methylorubrum extorquens]|uniref:Methyltransferase domain-containing protein n=1 Tax=Methylorubrum extorquens TaxID=408 RepID=A0AAX3WHV0_METEX|nr:MULTISPECIES: methyltransferase domain-containing protein [Methylobacteriaceae]KQO91241.1 SAM-dependent methyltransferase [Methylobacterium sp. Leaf92]KQQ20279.1 SAM-dependent methyltransferase [Methylobacterium sp. Leaf122]WHQ70324.1 methyltransferase domain-containing protein [Methylorubrum extorquens]